MVKGVQDINSAVSAAVNTLKALNGSNVSPQVAALIIDKTAADCDVDKNILYTLIGSLWPELKGLILWGKMNAIKGEDYAG